MNRPSVRATLRMLFGLMALAAFATTAVAAKAGKDENKGAKPAKAEGAKAPAAKPVKALAEKAVAKVPAKKAPARKPAPGGSGGKSAGAAGEALYGMLSKARRSKAVRTLFDRLNAAARTQSWKKGTTRELTGNLRLLRTRAGKSGARVRKLYLVRELSGAVHVLSVPANVATLKKGSGSPYANLKSKLRNKMKLSVTATTSVVDGRTYGFMKLLKPPKRLLLDRLFFIAIVALLFLTMVGMGLTLTVGDFGLVFKKPLGMIIGPICQFGLLPLVAMLLGRLAGFYDTYPYIFLGMILIAASPGGVTSNLMTYLGKGDVALSVSLTAVCTVLSLFFTPLLLTVYVSNIPDINIPVMDVVKQILILVIVPLIIGMLIRAKAEAFAKRAEKIFAAIGVFALLFLIVVGVWSNLEKFSDTARYGVKFYAMVFVLTLCGMVLAALLAKLVRVPNFQVRAISLECGLRNASLAMTIAILLQDRIGDFHSSMFFTSGIFGLWMYIAGALTIFLFKHLLPVKEEPAED